jgi:6-oxo-cyclohex-1-ene-carbonyl-CoA hydrolase
MVVTDRWMDYAGRVVFGAMKGGEALAEGKQVFRSGEIDLGPLDDAVDATVTKLLLTFPNCTMTTIESVRRQKLLHWDRNREQNRQWLGLNMMTEAHLGFRAFNEGPRGKREIDYVELRRRLAMGEPWGPELIEAMIPREDPGAAT